MVDRPIEVHAGDNDLEHVQVHILGRKALRTVEQRRLMDAHIEQHLAAAARKLQAQVAAQAQAQAAAQAPQKPPQAPQRQPGGDILADLARQIQ